MPAISRRLFCGAATASAAFGLSQLAAAEPKEIHLLVRGDDMGAARSFNTACIESYRKGIVRSVEVIVPGPWFLDAVKRLQEAPELDVGVHLCLTSEWDAVKWRPLTSAPSLVDANGYFHPRTRAGKDSPPGITGFVDSAPKLEEVERELRAQITMLLRHLPKATHLSAHMGAALATPEIKAVSQNLAKEFRLRLEGGELKTPLRHVAGVGASKQTAEEKEQSMLDALAKLDQGTWLLVTHPAYDDAETRGIGHVGYENVAADRDGITKMLTSPRVAAAIKDRGIRPISYADLR